MGPSAGTWGFVVAALVLYAAAAFAGLVLSAIGFAGNPHAGLGTPTPWHNFSTPAIAGLVVMLVAMPVLDWLLLRRRQVASSERRWAWAAPLVIAVVAVAAVEGLKLFGAYAGVRRSTELSDDYARRWLAESWSGRSALGAIAADRNVALDTRAHAAYEIELKRTNGAASPAVDALLAELLGRPDANARMAARLILIPGHADRLPQVLQLLGTADEAAMVEILQMLRMKWEGSEAAYLDRLEALLVDPRPRVREHARYTYFNRPLHYEHYPGGRPRSADELARLRLLLIAPDPELRLLAAHVLTQYDRAASDGVAAGVLPIALEAIRRGGGATATLNRFQIGMEVVGESHDISSAPILWTVANCPARRLEDRAVSQRSLGAMFRTPTGDIAVPVAYQISQKPYETPDLAAAMARPEWRAEYCPASR